MGRDDNRRADRRFLVKAAAPIKRGGASRAPRPRLPVPAAQYIWRDAPCGAEEGAVPIMFSRLRAIAIAIVAGLTVASCGYNDIPTLEESAKAQWAQVENQYQRRADRIPNLVSTVQGYAKQEK